MADESDNLGNGKPDASAARDAGAEYIVALIHELATLARNYGEVPMAIHLEAIIAARRAQAHARRKPTPDPAY